MPLFSFEMKIDRQIKCTRLRQPETGSKSNTLTALNNPHAGYIIHTYIFPQIKILDVHVIKIVSIAVKL